MRIRFKYILFLPFLLMAGNALLAQERLTLQDALKTARLQNPALQTEQFNIDVAEADVVTAGLRPNLILGNETIQMTQSRHFHENSKWHSPYNREVVWQLGKPFQIAGQRRHRMELANKELQLTSKEYAETERNLYSKVAEKWLEVWTAQKQLDMLQIAKGNIDSLLRSNEVRYRNEVITETDLFRTELLAKQYAIQYKTALQEVVNHQNELKFLVGVQGNISIDTADNFMFPIPGTIDSLIALSVTTRSDIQAARAMVEVSGSNIKLQKSLAYPQPELGLMWNPQNAVPHLGIYASIDLPFSDRNQGEIKKSRVLKEQADKHLTTLETQIHTEITVAFAEYKLHQENIESFQSLLTQAQTILDNVKYSYLRGGTTIIDFLEAQRSWLETQQQYYEAIQQFRQAYIQLLYSTGLIHELAL